MPSIVDDRPLVIVTPTYDRPLRVALLERCIATFRGVAGLHWIVVEDAAEPHPQIAALLAQSGIDHVYLAAGPTRAWGNAQRDVGLLRAFPGAIWTHRARGGETEFLERLVDSAEALEILCDGGRRCYAWHDLPLGQSPRQALLAYRLRRSAYFLVWRPARRLFGARR